jgi:hypothetical protein
MNDANYTLRALLIFSAKSYSGCEELLDDAATGKAGDYPSYRSGSN